MAYHVLPKRLAQLGFCCAWEYFNATRGASTTDISKELKVHLRTARRWRSKWRDGKLDCEKLTGCFQKIPDQCPDSADESESFLSSFPSSRSE